MWLNSVVLSCIIFRYFMHLYRMLTLPTDANYSPVSTTHHYVCSTSVMANELIKFLLFSSSFNGCFPRKPAVTIPLQFPLFICCRKEPLAFCKARFVIQPTVSKQWRKAKQWPDQGQITESPILSWCTTGLLRHCSHQHLIPSTNLDIDMCTAAAISATLLLPPTVRAQRDAATDIYVDRHSGMTV